MTETEFTVAGRWLIAAFPIGLGLSILAFNVLRYVPWLRRGNDTPGARGRLPSSLPLVGSLGVLFGLYIAPIEFRAAYLSILVLEIFSVDIGVEEDDLREPPGQS